MTNQLLEQPLATSEKQDCERQVLIVDDDSAMTDILSHRLKKQGFKTTTAFTGEDGLAVAARSHPDLIVLDLRLPDLDGFEICRRLSDDARTFDIPVIILSGMERPDIIRRSRAAGCQYFVRKPYDPNALLLLIKQAMDDSDVW